MKAIVFERQQGNHQAALEALNTALGKYPKFSKFYMIKGQIQHASDDIPAARATYGAGMKACPKDVRLWILASRLEEADDKRIMARALLNKARLVNPADEHLWAEAVHLEERAGASNQAKTNLAKGTCISPVSALCTNDDNRLTRMPYIWHSVVHVHHVRGSSGSTREIT